MATVYIAPTGGDHDQVPIQAALNAGNDVQLSAGYYRISSTSATINGANFGIHVPANRTLAGAGKDLTQIEWVGANSTQAIAIGTKDELGSTVRDFTVFTKTRSVPGLGTGGGSLLNFNYSIGTGATYTITRVRAKNAPAQQLQLNNVDTTGGGTVTITDCEFLADQNPNVVSHGVDIDVTANDKLTKGVQFTGCTFDSFGQECLKLENAESNTFTNCIFKTYVTFVQDTTPYSYFGSMQFTNCTFYGFITCNELTRRRNGGVPDNGGPGTVTFTNCTFSGDDALIIGQNNTLNKYGTITVTNCTFTGINSHFLPPGTWVQTGSSGWKTKPTFWVSQGTQPKYSIVVGDVTGTNGQYLTVKGIGVSRSINSALTSIGTAIASSADLTGWSNFGLATSGFDLAVAPGTFAESVGAGLSVNVPYNLYASQGLGSVTIYGNTLSSNVAGLNLAGTNTQRVKITGLVVQGFKNQSSTRGFTVNNANALVELDNCRFVGNVCTNTGGGGRVQAASFVYIHDCEFISNGATTNGGGLQLDANTFVLNNKFVANDAPTAGAVIRVGAASGTITICNNLIVKNTGSVSLSVSSAGALVTNVFNNTFAENGTTSTAGPADFNTGSASNITNLVNNIFASSGVPWSKSSTGTLNYQNNYYTSATITGSNNNDRGGNLTSGTVGFFDSNKNNYRLNATSVVKAAGVNIPHSSIGGTLFLSRDLDNRHANLASVSLGAYQYG